MRWLIGPSLCCLVGAMFIFGSGAAFEQVKTTNATYALGRSALELTPAEQAWLAEHPTIRVAFDGYFPPYSFLNDHGAFEGLAIDVMQLLATRVGIKLEPFPQAVWKDLYTAAQKHEVDLVATMGDRPERAEWFVFTRPYIFKSLVIMTHEDDRAITSPEDLADQRVALVKSYQYVRPLLKKYPSIQPYYVGTMLDGLNAVAVGKADAAITLLGAAHYLKTRYQISNLKFAAVFEKDKFSESIGIRNDWPELAAILDKALASISTEEMQTISHHWIPHEITPGITSRLIYISLTVILGVGILLIGGFILWTRTLKRQVAESTAELQQELAQHQETSSALQISEELFRHYFEQANIGFSLTSPQKGWLRANKYLCDMLGYSEEELLTKDWAEMTYPEDLEPDIKQFNRVLAGEIDRYDLEKRFYRKNGEISPVHMTISCLRNPDGSAKYIIATLEDTTERTKTKQELELHRNHLEQMVAERTEALQKTQQALQFMLEDLNEANERLREIDQLKSMFIASMSHELRTPLNSVIGFSSILLNEWTGPLNDEQKQNLSSILRSGKHLLALINDVIDISKIEAGMIEVNRADFDLAELLAEAGRTFVQKAEKKKLFLTLPQPLPHLKMHTDRRRLLECVINLLSNGLKYTEQGGVRVDIAQDTAGESVTIRVIDTGIGIAAENQLQLFKAFSRIPSEISARVQGTGLGLYLTQKIVVEILQGTLSLASQTGSGSTFSICIPCRVEDEVQTSS